MQSQKTEKNPILGHF